MCRSRLRALYCVNTRIRRRSLLRQLESGKSTMRYRPPNGTAGLARSRVSGSRRVPLPPARINVRTFFTMPLSSCESVNSILIGLSRVKKQKAKRKNEAHALAPKRKDESGQFLGAFAPLREIFHAPMLR